MIVGVAYAKPNLQIWKHVEVPEGTTAVQAIDRAGLLAQFPEIDLSVMKVGIFGQICPADRVLKEGDRVEIYRPIHPEAELLDKKP